MRLREVPPAVSHLATLTRDATKLADDPPNHRVLLREIRDEAELLAIDPQFTPDAIPKLVRVSCSPYPNRGRYGDNTVKGLLTELFRKAGSSAEEYFGVISKALRTAMIESGKTEAEAETAIRNLRAAAKQN